MPGKNVVGLSNSVRLVIRTLSQLGLWRVTAIGTQNHMRAGRSLALQGGLARDMCFGLEMAGARARDQTKVCRVGTPEWVPVELRGHIQTCRCSGHGACRVHHCFRITTL